MTPEEFAKAPLSAVIRVALDDLAKVEADPAYLVNMFTWHEPIGGQCHVCLAGAVMAGTIGIPTERFIDVPGAAVLKMSGDAADGARARLMALNMVRRGDIGDAIIWSGATSPQGACWPTVTPYEADPAAFRRDLLDVAAALEAEGL